MFNLDLKRLLNYIEICKAQGKTELEFFDILMAIGISEQKVGKYAEILKKHEHIKNYSLPKKIEGKIEL